MPTLPTLCNYEKNVDPYFANTIPLKCLTLIKTESCGHNSGKKVKDDFYCKWKVHLCCKINRWVYFWWMYNIQGHTSSTWIMYEEIKRCQQTMSRADRVCFFIEKYLPDYRFLKVLQRFSWLTQNSWINICFRN